MLRDTLMLRFKILLFLFFLFFDLTAQVNTSNISIVRDKWGVPHVYAKTDKEAATDSLGLTQKMTSKQFRKHFYQPKVYLENSKVVEEQF